MWYVILISFIVRNSEYGSMLGSFFAASLAQCIAVSASFLL